MTEVGVDPAAEVARVFKESSGQAVATLIRFLGDFDLAEEAVADAFATAVERWPRDGLPGKPAAWILTTAKRRAIDVIRRRQSLQSKAALLEPLLRGTESPMDMLDEEPVADDQLRLIFTCCHPALSAEARVALTLRTLGGLSTAEIARAFLVPDSTMAQRLVRAKSKIRLAGIPYELPPAHQLPGRLGSVLAVLYLIFNEGYAPSSGSAVMRRDLCTEAIRLARVLATLMPDEPEALSMLALMLFHDARAAGRTAPDGSAILLEDQDEGTWDEASIREAAAVLARAERRGLVGPYLLQARIARVHAQRPSAGETDWAVIASLYRGLEALTGSPVVTLNRAVATALGGDFSLGIDMLDELDRSQALAGYHRLPAARAELLWRSGRSAEALQYYERALELVSSDVERAFLLGRVAAVSVPRSAGHAPRRRPPYPQ